MDSEPQISLGDDAGQAPGGVPPDQTAPPLDGLLRRLFAACARRLRWLLAAWLLLLLLTGAALAGAGWLADPALAWRLALGALAGLLAAALLLMSLVAAPLREHGRALRAWADHLRRLDRQLDRLRGERDSALQAAAARTRFFAAAGHDLRQPLHALSINALALSIRAQRQGDEHLVQLAADIERALAQGNSLLDGLLEVSRLDAGAVRPEMAAVDLAALLNGVVAEYAALAAQRGLALRVETGGHGAPPWVVRSDPGLLRRVVVNLVVNALKFTDRGGVALRVDAAPDGRILLEVHDTGIGIAPDVQDRVFDEFYQDSAAGSGRGQGLGLGLAIVRRLCALLDIAVSLASVPGEGTRVALRLPTVDSGELPADGAPATGAATTAACPRPR